MTEVELAQRESMAAGLIALAEEIKRPGFPIPNSINYTVDANVWGFTPIVDDETGEEIGTGTYGMMQARQYVKRPFIYEAIQFNGTPESCTEVTDFLGGPHSENHRWNLNTLTGGQLLDRNH